ncbi:MAG: hypothetical protein LIO81_03090 [Clostridiales bacterium]|nr:hypothetical protein [Clostridiales bacterium]
MSSSAIIICLLGIVVAIALGYKFNINMGTTGLVFAWIVGCLMMQMKVKEVVALWPTAVMFQLMSITLFFGFACCNGTMQAVADHLLYAVRNQSWLIGFAIFFIAIILGAIGCPPPAANAIMAVIGFSIGLPAGLHPVIIAWTVCHGANIGACMPWAASGAVVNATIAANGFEAEAAGMTWEFFFAYFVITTAILVVMYILLKGHKLNTINVSKPEPFNDIQKKNLVIIAIVVILVVVPSMLTKFVKNDTLSFLSARLDIQMLSFVGFVVCALMNIADQKAVIRSVPWNTIILIGGIGTLMNVATAAGVVDLLSSWLNNSVPEGLMVSFMTILGGFLSFFSGGINTVFPMLAPMVGPAVAGTAIKPVTMFIGILLGACYTALSPFSTGGAIFMSNCQDEKVRGKLIGWQLGLAALGLVVSAILAAIGILGIF